MAAGQDEPGSATPEVFFFLVSLTEIPHPVWPRSGLVPHGPLHKQSCVSLSTLAVRLYGGRVSSFITSETCKPRGCNVPCKGMERNEFRSWI